MKIILDTNFIINCIKEKIDFLDELSFYGKIIVPKQVKQELEKISQNKKSKLKDREAAQVGLQIVSEAGRDIGEINLEKKFVDRGIVKYIEDSESKDYIVATFDKALKKDLKDKIKIIGVRARKKLEFVN